MKYASFGRRFSGVLFDGMIMQLCDLALVSYVSASRSQDYLETMTHLGWVNRGILWALALSYHWIPLKLFGATLGMRVFSMKMIGENQKALTWKIVILRWLYSYVSALALSIGYFAALWDKKNQTWHDRWAKTLVIKTSKEVYKSEWLSERGASKRLKETKNRMRSTAQRSGKKQIRPKRKA